MSLAGQLERFTAAPLGIVVMTQLKVSHAEIADVMCQRLSIAKLPPDADRCLVVLDSLLIGAQLKVHITEIAEVVRFVLPMLALCRLNAMAC